MIKTYVLIMIISGFSDAGKTTVTQEFSTLKQCQYVESVIKKQIKSSSGDFITASGCFEK